MHHQTGVRSVKYENKSHTGTIIHGLPAPAIRLWHPAKPTHAARH
jgi:hypothetical protein